MPQDDGFSDSLGAASEARPFVCDTKGGKSLHFTYGETQSRMRPRDPDALDLEYTRTMMGFVLFHRQPGSIAMVGLGGGSLAKFCHRHLAQSRMVVVEINSHVVALRDDFRVPADDERFCVVLGDGAAFLGAHPARHDVLLLDGFVSHGLPERLCSQVFYDDCRRSLLPGGIAVFNLHTSHPDIDAQLARLRRSFTDAVLLVPDDDHCNTIVFAFEDAGTMGRLGPALMRPPTCLDSPGVNQLLGAFSRIGSAVRRSSR
jgi:spermidine synthase